MKCILNVTAMVCLLVTTTSVMAVVQAPVELKVQGKIRVGSCTPIFVNGNVLDLGMMPVSEVPEYGGIAHGKKIVPISVTCTHPSSIGFSVTDNNSVSPAVTNELGFASDALFGLGQTNSKIDIGGYAIQLSNAFVDGSEALFMYRDSIWKPSAVGRHITIDPRENLRTFGSKGGSTPISGKIFSFNMDVQPYLSRKMRIVSDEVNLDGRLTINFIYL